MQNSVSTLTYNVSIWISIARIFYMYTASPTSYTGITSSYEGAVKQSIVYANICVVYTHEKLF